MAEIIQVPAHLNNYRNDTNRGSLALKTKKYGIVFHWIVGELEVADRAFVNPDRRASAHFGVGSNGEVHQYVDEDLVAWHAGNRQANEKYIGIEMAGGILQSNGKRSLPNRACTNATIELAVAICKKHGIDKLEYQNNAWRHNQVSDRYTGCSLIDVQNIVDKVNKQLEIHGVEISEEYYTVQKAGWYWSVWNEMFRAGAVEEYWASYKDQMIELNGVNRYVLAGERIKLQKEVAVPPPETPLESIPNPSPQEEPVGEDEETYNDVEQADEQPIIDQENNIVVAEPIEEVVEEEVVELVETATGEEAETEEAQKVQLDVAEDNLKKALDIIKDKKKQLDPSFLVKLYKAIKGHLTASTVAKIVVGVITALGIGVSRVLEIAADYVDLIIAGAGLLGIATIGFVPKIKELFISIKSKFKK